MSATCEQNLVIAIERYLVKTDVRWDLSDSDLLDMTPIKARDLIVECFYQAQKRPFLMQVEELGRHRTKLNCETPSLGLCGWL